MRVQLAVGTSTVQPDPVIDVAVRPAGRKLVTFTLPAVAAGPAFETVIVQRSPTSACVNTPECVSVATRSATGGAAKATTPSTTKSGARLLLVSKTYQVPADEVPPQF